VGATDALYNFCNISACGVKCIGIYISGLTFV
jgi:hypothetical protein